MNYICPKCRKCFKNIRNHFLRSPACAAGNVSATPPIPTVVTTGVSDNPTEKSFNTDSSITRTSNRRRTAVNYSETAAKRARSTQPAEDCFPTPDENLDDYMHTYFDEEDAVPLSSTRCPAPHNHDHTSQLAPHCPPEIDPRNIDMEVVAAEAWHSLYASLMTHNSVGAVAPPPSGSLIADTDNEDQGVEDLAGESRIGKVVTITMQEQNSRVVATPHDRSMARIYQVCDQAGSPRYLADLIITQLRKETLQNGFDPCHSSITRRDAFMHRATKSTGSIPPEAIRITLESGQTVTVLRFPFRQQLQEHLLSSVFSDLKNLSVNTSDPWGFYTKNGLILKDFLDGTWYPTTYELFRRSKVDLHNYILHCVIGYVDKTHGDGIEKNSLEPFMMTSAGAKQAIREDSKSWFCVGFVPNLTMISAAARRGQKGCQYTKSAALRDYHRCFQVLLQPLKDMQKSNPVLLFRRGDLVKCLRIVIPFAGMVGDNKSQDTLAARKVNYGKSTPRLSRRCLTTYACSANSVHSCFPVNAQAIECLSMGALGCTYGARTIPQEGAARSTLPYASIPLSNNFDHWVLLLETIKTKAAKKRYVRYRRLRQKLCVQILHRVFGSHPVDNAFFGLDMGSNREGIFRATLVDILHTIEEGLIPKFLVVFYGLMGDKQRAKVDSLVESLFGEGHNRSSERNSYPRVSFTRGYTQLTRLSANERQGQLFVLAVLLQTETGREVLEPRFALDFDEKRSRARNLMAGESMTREQVNPNSPEGFSGAAMEVDTDDGGGEEDDGGSNGSGDNEESEEESEEESQGETSVSKSLEGQDDEDESIDNDVKDNLDRLDLSYIYQGIYPNLETFHKDRFNGVIREVLTAYNLSAITKVQFPRGLLDYRTVNRPIRLLTPEVSNIEKDLPEFKVPEERKENSIKLPMEQFVYLVETLLSFISFLKYGCDLLVSRPSGSVEYDKALELFLRMLVSTVERAESSNQWFLQKTVEMVHFKQDILSMGPASGFSTETGERGLKAWAKQPSKTAQRRGDEVFSKQVCQRIHEAAIINSIADSLPLEKEGSRTSTGEGDKIETRGAKFVVLFRPSTAIHRVLPSGKKHKIQLDFPDVVKEWFAKKYSGGLEAITSIQLFTEMILPQDNGEKGTLLRAHPNYRSEGPWYDYTLAKYDEVGRGDMNPVYPCKLACFFTHPESGDKMALVQEVHFQNERQLERESQLFQHWTLRSRENRDTKSHDALLNAIPVEALSDRIYVIDPNPIGGFTRAEASNFDILVVKYNREEWPLSFLKSPEYFARYQWS
jgi:hypothetical protein